MDSSTTCLRSLVHQYVRSSTFARTHTYFNAHAHAYTGTHTHASAHGNTTTKIRFPICDYSLTITAPITEAARNGTRLKAARERRQLVARAMMNATTNTVKFWRKLLILSDIPLVTFTISLKRNGHTGSCSSFTFIILNNVVTK